MDTIMDIITVMIMGNFSFRTFFISALLIILFDSSPKNIVMKVNTMVIMSIMDGDTMEDIMVMVTGEYDHC